MKIALVGIGKIAKDQHVPAISDSPEWELAATVSRNGTVEGVEAFKNIRQMLTTRPDIPVVSLALPPVPRFDAAMEVIASGRHVMLEKPPGAGASECMALSGAAAAAGVTLFTTWHSREAAMVDTAQEWLSDKMIHSVQVAWAEDVRRWHPGQDWVFEPGGMGVFDPGINALSILTKILPNPIRLHSARLEIPANRQMPIGAELWFSDNISATFDWRKTGQQVWDIVVETDAGSLSLLAGGNVLLINDEPYRFGEVIAGEYARLYDRMARLVELGQSDVDFSPMMHVADAFMLGERVTCAPFEWEDVPISAAE